MKKTIVVNDIAASSGGGLTVLKEFYNAVIRSRKDIDWVFLLSEKHIEETENVKICILPKVKKYINRIVFDSFTGAKMINSFDPVVVVSLQNTVVYHCQGKKVTYIHQALPFQNIKKYSFCRKEEFGLACIQYLLGWRIKQSIKASDMNIVQSKWMKEAVEKKCSIKNVRQIYPNMPIIHRKAIYDTTNTFFYPTGNVSYKNNSLLISACKRMSAEGIDCSTVITIDKLEDVDNISYIGRIPINEVYEYYDKSCLVFPSYIETFGYPIVEARSVGSIILVSDCEFSHELLDGYENAYFFNPFDANELFNLMKNVATGFIKRKNVKNEFNLNTELEGCNNSWDQIVNEILLIALGK